MKFDIELQHRNEPKEALLADLRQIAQRLGCDGITSRAYKEAGGKYAISTFLRRFGSWNQALEMAGLKVKKLQSVSDAIFYQEIANVWVKLGHQPRMREMRRPLSQLTGSAYQNRFGTWQNALIAFAKHMNEAESTDKGISNAKSSRTSPGIRRTKRNPSLRLLFRVLKRDNFTCQSCGASPSKDPRVTLEVDHKTPYSKEGETVFDNLQVLCKGCNAGKGDLHWTPTDFFNQN